MLSGSRMSVDDISRVLPPAFWHGIRHIEHCPPVHQLFALEMINLRRITISVELRRQEPRQEPRYSDLNAFLTNAYEDQYLSNAIVDMSRSQDKLQEYLKLMTSRYRSLVYIKAGAEYRESHQRPCSGWALRKVSRAQRT